MPHPIEQQRSRSWPARPPLAHVDLRSPEDGSVVVRVGGEIDHGTADLLRQGLYDAVATGAREVVVDLGAVTFFCAAGLAELVVTQRTLRSGGRRLVIREVPAAVSWLLAVTHLDALTSVAAPAAWSAVQPVA